MLQLYLWTGVSESFLPTCLGAAAANKRPSGLVLPFWPLRDPSPNWEKEDYPFGANFMGVRGGFVGLDIAAQLTAISLVRVGVPMVYYDMPGQRNPYLFNFVHTSAHSVSMMWSVLPMARGNRINIGFWFWEVSMFPPQWRGSFDYYDELWVHSYHTQKVLQPYTSIPVRHIPAPCPFFEDIVENTIADKSFFGWEASSFVFYYNFDVRSVPERKNPWAAIKAFKMAFPTNSCVINEQTGEKAKVQMILKLAGVTEKGVHPLEIELKKMAHGLNIVFDNKTLGPHVMPKVFASLDCYLSLHRTEGLGFGMMQAMAFAKPVIATAWSGNMDFCTEENSYLVRYSLTTLNHTIGNYLKGSEWAEPEVEHAAELMLRVVQKQAEAKEKGLRGQQTMLQNHSLDAVGRALEAEMHASVKRVREVWRKKLRAPV